MEEGASFWPPLLAWRSFAAACVTTIALYGWDWLWALIKALLTGEEIDSHSNFFDINSMAIYSGLPGQHTGGTSVDLDSSEIFFRTIPSFRVYDFAFFALI